MRYYDQEHRRLVYIEENATPEFWDRQWEDEKLKKYVLTGQTERFVYPTTKKYLKPGARILEGGCGKGRFVYSLHSKGYETYGLDFAERVIVRLKSLFPNMHFELGDVRHLPYQDDFFDGYWSLGVIEHFYDGYEAIAREMERVIKPDGYLFLTFPHMSLLRKIKAFLGFYPLFNRNNFETKNFYQFALPDQPVIQTFKKFGFELVECRPYDGFKGVKDESGLLKPVFQSIYNGKSIFNRIIEYGFSFITSPFAGHAVLLVLRKK